MCKVAGASVLLAVLAGCGSSSNSGGTSGSGGSKGLSGTPITLGIIMSTDYLKTAIPGAQAAVDAINASGGIKGHPLKLRVCDNQKDGNAAAACARNFVSDSSLVATVGDNNSFGSDSNPPLAAAKIAGVGTSPLGAGDYTSPRVFPSNSGGLEFLGSATFLYKTLGITDIGMAVNATPTAAALPALLNAAVLGPLGGKLDRTTTIAPTATDVSAQAASLSSTKGQLLAILQAVTERYITASRQQGYQGPFVGSETTLDAAAFKKDLNAADLHDLFAITYFDKTSAGYASFVKDMKTYEKDVAPGDLAGIAWMSVKMFQTVASALPSITRDTVWNAMNQQSDLSTDGMTGNLSFTSPGTALGGKAPRLFDSVQKVYIDKYSNGTWVPYASPQTPIALFPPAK
jgi:ABC-type branched-subunit amino acid transport system substrate-binding protein